MRASENSTENHPMEKYFELHYALVSFPPKITRQQTHSFMQKTIGRYENCRLILSATSTCCITSGRYQAKKMESTEGNNIYLEEQILFCRLVAVTLGELVPESLAVVRERGGRDEQVMIFPYFITRSAETDARHQAKRR